MAALALANSPYDCERRKSSGESCRPVVLVCLHLPVVELFFRHCIHGLIIYRSRPGFFVTSLLRGRRSGGTVGVSTTPSIERFGD
jgi:hypothetical protein